MYSQGDLSGTKQMQFNILKEQLPVVSQSHANLSKGHTLNSDQLEFSNYNIHVHDKSIELEQLENKNLR